ncbi:MAG: hypothetical protein ACK42C_09445, partial [Aquificaceae bacterium]
HFSGEFPRKNLKAPLRGLWGEGAIEWRIWSIFYYSSLTIHCQALSEDEILPKNKHKLTILNHTKQENVKFTSQVFMRVWLIFEVERRGLEPPTSYTPRREAVV